MPSLPIDERVAKPRVHVLYEHDVYGNPHGSAYIRLLHPLAHEAFRDAIEVSAGRDVPMDDGTQVVIVDRLWHGWGYAGAIDFLFEQKARQGFALIHALDDDLYRLDAEGDSAYPVDQVRRLSRGADCVVVTTEPLARRAGHYNPNVRVIRNGVDPDLFSVQRPEGDADKRTLGYMGTFTHLDDMRMVLEPLRRFLGRQAGKWTLDLVGVGARAELKALFPQAHTRVLAPPDGAHYPDFIRWWAANCRWDMAIAPLRDTPFTRAKSDLKYLDYTMLGCPGIYSAHQAYRETVRENVNGLLATEQTDDWFAQLQRMAKDESLRERLLRAARDDVLTHRQVRHVASAWVTTVLDVITSAVDSDNLAH
jgi:glycosyltransferase involved in cell wall biosynthesis